MFSGLMEYKRDKPGWDYDGFLGPVPDRLLAVRHARVTRWASPGAARRTRRPGRKEAQCKPKPGEPFEHGHPTLDQAGRPRAIETLKHPHCVFQLVKSHFSRYTPEMVRAGDRLPAGNVH